VPCNISETSFKGFQNNVQRNTQCRNKELEDITQNGHSLLQMFSSVIRAKSERMREQYQVAHIGYIRNAYNFI
jgi:negative regulator of sigma E activity